MLVFPYWAAYVPVPLGYPFNSSLPYEKNITGMPGRCQPRILGVMAAHTLRINKTALNAEGLDTARKAVNRVVRRTFTRSQVLAPVDTGNLRASGKLDLASDRGLLVVGGVSYTARYAAAVHEGRRALTIRAKGNGRLKFTVGGRTVYARQVHQPARAGRPYLSTALREVAAQEGFSVRFG